MGSCGKGYEGVSLGGKDDGESAACDRVLAAGVSPPPGMTADDRSSSVPRPASSLASSFCSASDTPGKPSSSSSPPAGPGVGLLPSLIALRISVVFHLQYLIFSFTCEVR